MITYFLCFKKRPKYTSQPDRHILSQKLDKNLPNNKIKTNKYTPLTFLPLNLYDQFSKLANTYFLFIGLMQLIPIISISDGKPVIYLPLMVVVLISALRDLFEDYKRYRAD